VIFPRFSNGLLPAQILSTFLPSSRKERKKERIPRPEKPPLHYNNRLGLQVCEREREREEILRASKRGEAHGWMICLRKAHEDEKHCSTSSRFGVRFCESLVLVQDFDLISIHLLLLLLLLPRLVKGDKTGKNHISIP
jgi:hypothetical protein